MIGLPSRRFFSASTASLFPLLWGRAGSRDDTQTGLRLRLVSATGPARWSAWFWEFRSRVG